jgi:dTDP-4-amino-4,6-dideoxygalactose transaminase
LYTIRVPDRDGLQAQLEARGIAAAIHYPKPLHLQPALAALGGRPGDLPVSEELSRQVISLPLYPELPLPSVARIAAEVRAYCVSAVA